MAKRRLPQVRDVPWGEFRRRAGTVFLMLQAGWLALSEAERASLLGRYTFGDGPRDAFVVSMQKNQLMIARAGAMERGIFHQGQLAFHAAGGPSTIIRFEREGDRIVALTVHDPDPVVRARRM